MYIVLWEAEEEFEYLFDAEARADELPGSMIINLDLEDEEV